LHNVPDLGVITFAHQWNKRLIFSDLELKISDSVAI
jgi:hypothetical protein